MNYHNISKDDMLNGEGLRVVLWVSGCNHYCPDCQNPVTWDPTDGIPYDKNAWLEIDEQLKQDYISGITFSGGDPLHPQNRKTVISIANAIRHKYPDKTIWLYTGYLWEEVCDIPGLSNIDILVDGPFIKKLADVNYHWAGSTNQRVIDVKQSLSNGTIVLYKEYLNQFFEKDETHYIGINNEHCNCR